MIGKGQKLEENMENTTLPICEIYNADESQQNRDSWNHRLGEKHGVSKNCRKNRTPAFPYGCALLEKRMDRGAGSGVHQRTGGNFEKQSAMDNRGMDQRTLGRANTAGGFDHLFGLCGLEGGRALPRACD